MQASRAGTRRRTARRAGRLHPGRHPPLRQGRRARRHLARHSARHHGRHHRPRRRRQVDAPGADRRLEEDAGRGRSTCSTATSPTSGTGAPSARGSRTCRRAWARTSTSSSASTTTSTSWRSSSGCSRAERPARIQELLDATGLGPFPDRPAGKLSGGMKQKVGLCGALVHDPDLLILDEPTTGVDPLSRRQFWTLIDDIRADRPSMSVVISTAYMDEAQQWDWIVAMDAGRVLATGTPAELMERTGTKDLEHCFIALLPGGEAQRAHASSSIPPRAGRPTGDRHRGARPDPALRHLHRRRPRHAVDRARRDLRLPRLQRLRQVDDHEDADRPAAADRRHGDALRQLRSKPAAWRSARTSAT